MAYEIRPPLRDVNITGGYAPVINANNTLTVSGTAAVILPSYLSSVDSDSVTLTYTLTSPPGKGSLSNSYSQSIVSIGGAFTQADINAGYIVYTPLPGVSGEGQL